MSSTQQSPRTWTRDQFLTSTDQSLIPLPTLTAAFESEQIYWARGLPEQTMREMLDHSLCFGLYRLASSTKTAPGPEPGETLDNEVARTLQCGGQSEGSREGVLSLIGFARAVTDRVTLFYLTDVYVLPEWQGQGLGNWLISCVQEVVDSMPYLRRSMAIIGHERERRMAFYKRLMKMEPVQEPAVVLNWMGPGCVF